MKSIKRIILNKKIVAIILLLMTVLTNASPVFAVSGNDNWVGGQFDSQIRTTDDTGKYGMLIRKIINNSTKEAYTVFCAENHTPFKTGVIVNGDYYTPTDPTVKRACKIAYFGWYSKYGDYVIDGGILSEGLNYRKMDYVYTQQYIWETLGQTDASFIDYDIQEQYEVFKSNINSEINRMETRPSFDGTTVEIEVGETKVLTDTNGVLAEYLSTDNTKDNVRFQHNIGENTLTITALEDCTIESLNISDLTMKSWGCIKESSQDYDTSIYFSFSDGIQNQLYAMQYNDPVPMSLNLKINHFGSLELSKLNTNGDLVDGAVFTVTGENGYNNDVTVTNGKIKIENLKKGIYYVKEKSSPTGYLLNTETYIVEIKPNQTTTQAIVNTEPTGSITITKTNTNGDKVQGAKFNIIADEDIYNVAKTVKHYSKGDIVARIITNNTGVASKSGLPLGKYKVKEIEVPKGYLLNTEEKEVNLEYKDQNTNVIYGSVTIENEEPTGSITVTKTNTNGDKVQNAKFNIIANEDIYNVAKTVKYYSKGEIIATIITDNTGVASKSGLPLGKYKVKEIEVPKGYLLNTEEKEVNLEYKDQNTNVIYGSVTIENEEPTGNLIIEKIDRETGNKNRFDGTSHHGDATLKGTEYTLYAKERITNVEGTIKYFEQDEQIATFTFNEYGVASIKITNNTTPAKISIDGTMLIGLPMGKYYAKETIVPTGYTKDNKIYDYEFSYKDSSTKVIEIMGTTTNTVEKAPFEVIKVTTKDNTTAKTVANTEFTAILSKYVEFYGSFDEAKKHLNEFAEDEYSIFRTGTNGHGISGLLAYGEYTVNETYTPSPEIETVEQFYVTIDRDSKTPIKELVENDLPFEAYIKIEKKEKDTEKYVTYSNATFSLYKLNENNEWDRVQCKVGNRYFDSWTTDKKGIARTETKLEAGTYKVEEIKVPTGFIQLDGELRFEVNNRNKTLNYDKDFDAWITVIAENEQPTGTIKLKKSVELRKNVDKNLIKNIDYTKISFELVVDENVINYTDGSIIYEKGKVLGTYNLKKDGTLTITNLPMGKYHLKEITTIDGAVLDRTEHKVVLKQTDTKTKEYVVELEIENKLTEIRISKQDITGEQEIVGAKLTILNKNNEIIDSWTSTEKPHTIDGLKVGETYILREEITPDGYVKATEISFTVQNTSEIQTIKMIDKIVEMSKKDISGNEIEGAKLKVLDKDGKVVDSWVSTKDSHKIKGLTEGETYTLVEDYAPDGYVVSNSVEFTVTSNKETQKVEMIDKVVEVSKEDIAGNELEGAELKVLDKDGKVVDSWVSTKDSHKIKGLTEGETYTLVEDYAPDGYVISNSIEFTVTSDKETQKVKMIDKVVEVSKKDIAGNELEGATLVVTSKKTKNIVDKWVSTTESHKINGLIEGETYVLTEEIAIDGYVKATNIEFTVTSDKETQKVIMIDKVVEIVKTDLVTGEEIEGAELKVLDEDDNIIDEWTSTKEPHKVKGLEENKTYKLVEVTAPYGYELTEEIEFVVSEDKETQKIEMKDMPILKNIKVVKIDSKTKEVIKDKFTFGIYENQECTKIIKEVQANKEDGFVMFEDLRYGEYYIKELQAPTNYNISTEIVKVEINDKGVFIKGNLVEENGNAYSFEFENAPIETPKTSDNRNQTLLKAVAGISAISLAIMGLYGFIKRRKNK